MSQNDDLISRQAAIEAVGYYSLHRGDKLLFADKPLKELPSAQPQTKCIAKTMLNEKQIRDAVEKAKGEILAVLPRWIPCSERLPEKCNYYIVTDFDKVDEAYYNSDGRWFSWDGNKLKDVTAWMPLPEPYKKEKE